MYVSTQFVEQVIHVRPNITRCPRWFRSSRSGSRKDTRKRLNRSRGPSLDLGLGLCLSLSLSLGLGILSLGLGIRGPWFFPTTIPWIAEFVLSTGEQPNED